MKLFLITVAICSAFATIALGQAGSTDASQKSVDESIAALKSKDPKQREAAAVALAGHRNDQDRIIPALLDALHDDEDSVVKEVASSLASYGTPAMEKLTALLSDKNSQVRRGVARALGLLGEKGGPAVPKLIDLLANDPDPRVRRWVVRSLGQIGGAASAAVPSLLRALRDEDDRVVENAGKALDEICKSGVQPLVRALSDQDDVVREEAANVLGLIGSRAAEAVPRVVEALKDHDHRVQVAAARALGLTVEGLSDQVSNRRANIEQLDHAIELLSAIRQKLEEKDRAAFDKSAVAPVQAVLDSLRRQEEAETLESLTASLQRPWVRYGLGAALYLVVMLTFWSLLLWLKPLWLLSINSFLERYADIELPGWLGGVKLPNRATLLAGIFNYHPRVLDAWVGKFLPAVRDALAAKATVCDRSVHIPVPVICDGETISDLKPQQIKAFARKRSCLLIVGEGGAGKTSIACQIMRWAMSDLPDERPAGHLMLPVLIELDLDLSVADAAHVFSETVRGQLVAMIGESEPVPDLLFDRLMRSRRILVVVDGLSEMSEESRKLIRPGQPGFSAAALVVTSRQDQPLDGVPKTVLAPLRIEGNRLSSFLEAYLTKRGKRTLFDDPQFFEACGRLTLIVRDRKVTVLLAKLFADQLIARREGLVDDLPDSIPELMLCYLNELNRNATQGNLDDRAVQQDSCSIAWECLRSDFRPSPAPRDAVIAALGGNEPAARLHDLEHRLRLIQTVGPARDRVRIVLDPLAEYLAALYAIKLFGHDEGRWRKFLARLSDFRAGTESSGGFLLAMRDCCQSRISNGHFPPFVVEELNRLADGKKEPVAVRELSRDAS